jgi:putative redox protein
LRVHIRHVDGHTLVAKSDSNHWIPLDTGTASGGTGAANDPFQLFVIGCAGCTVVDVVDILTKSRQIPTRLELSLEATRAETVPKILRQLSFHFQVDGPNVSAQTVRRAIELSLTKYCSASLSLDRSIVFEARVTLNDQAQEPFEIARNPASFKD